MKTEKSEHSDLREYLTAGLAQRQSDRLLRSVRACTPISDTCVEIDGLQLINFGANDYLGMAWQLASSSWDNRQLANNSNAASEILMTKLGSGASPAVTGYTHVHDELARTIADFEGSESAMIFSSGYAANVGTVSAIASQGDVLFSDQLNHASLIDGCRLSRATTRVYPHVDLAALSQMLRSERHDYRHAFIVSDSVFSMDGDIAPLPELVELCEETNAFIILDEAHATGVLGKHGRGLTEHFQVSSDRIIKIGTLSKAVGSIGGFVAGSNLVCQWLANFARSWIYSTAPTLPSMRNATYSLRAIATMFEERERLQRSIAFLRNSLHNHGIATQPGITPIIPVYCGQPENVLAMSDALRERGLYVPAIRPPTVPEGKSMLRISLSSKHSQAELEQLVEAIISIWK